MLSMSLYGERLIRRRAATVTVPQYVLGMGPATVVVARPLEVRVLINTCIDRPRSVQDILSSAGDTEAETFATHDYTYLSGVSVSRKARFPGYSV